MRALLVAALLAGCSGASDDGADLAAPPDLAFPTSPHPAWPQFSAGDGVLLTPVTLVSVVAQNDAIGTTFLDFGDKLAHSQWWSTVAAEPKLGAVTHSRVTGPALTGTPTAADLSQYIASLISAGSAPAPDGHTIYVVYLPDNVVFKDTGGTLNTNCTIFSGAHFGYDAQFDNWAAVQRCRHDDQAGIDDATRTASHEILEAATDPTGGGWTLGTAPTPPWTGDPWLLAGFGTPEELGDSCAGSVWSEGGAQYQRIYANAAASAGGDPCLPAIDSPYFNVAPAQQWTQVAAGQAAQITLTGWSTQATSDWYLDYGVITSTGGSWKGGLGGANKITVGGTSYPTVNNGTTATMTLAPPAGAKSGSYIVVTLYSTPETASATPDLFHEWTIGAYVP